MYNLRLLLDGSKTVTSNPFWEYLLDEISNQQIAQAGNIAVGKSRTLEEMRYEQGRYYQMGREVFEAFVKGLVEDIKEKLKSGQS
ncbi:MAG: hypothetical protein ACYTFW_23030 [Planctomycetota bacterium]|jgi:hypothetical protein